jgi:hypothetical protein
MPLPPRVEVKGRKSSFCPPLLIRREGDGTQKEGGMKLCKREELELMSSTVVRDWSLKFSRRDVLELRRSSVGWRGSCSVRMRTISIGRRDFRSVEGRDWS